MKVMGWRLRLPMAALAERLSAVANGVSYWFHAWREACLSGSATFAAGLPTGSRFRTVGTSAECSRGMYCGSCPSERSTAGRASQRSGRTMGRSLSCE